MRIFIGWSGGVSQRAAEAVGLWLRETIQATEPFVSSQGIATGSRALGILAAELEESRFGIFCVSKRTQTAPWINFEAGALSRSLNEPLVVPLLLDLAPADLDGPLAQFQGVDSRSRESMYQLAETINTKLDSPPLPEGLLQRAFDRSWTGIEKQLRSVRFDLEHEKPQRTGWQHSNRELLEECLQLLRDRSTLNWATIPPAPALHTNVTDAKVAELLIDRKLYHEEKLEVERIISLAVENYLPRPTNFSIAWRGRNATVVLGTEKTDELRAAFNRIARTHNVFLGGSYGQRISAHYDDELIFEITRG